VLAVTTTAAHASVRWATLEAIHQLENPRDLPNPGPFGELGAYQFRAETWHMHTAMPFARALDRSTSDEVAVRHYEWIKAGLERAGVPVTPYAVGLAWNGGLDAAINGRSPRIARDYAQRVANLAASLHGAAPAAATPPAAIATTTTPLIVPTPSFESEPFVVTLPRSVPTPVITSKPFVVALR